jgi:uncharacterized protein YdeI (YjbR/CyaY-like superfamily)
VTLQRDGKVYCPVAFHPKTLPQCGRLPADLARAFRGRRAAARKWDALSYGHRAEYLDAIDTARKTETRARRLSVSLRVIEGINFMVKEDRR